MLEVKRLTKKYGSLVAVDNLNFTVSKGEILGLLGPNGAGKSTTMKILTGYMPSTEGTVKISGLDIIDDYREAKKKIGYLPEKPPLYGDMTVKEYLYFVCELKAVKKKKRKENVDNVITKLYLQNVQNRLIRNLSKGYQQRVGLAQAIIGESELLILDEPTVGLDPKQIIEIRQLIKELGKDHTIILSSHILSEVSEVCERVIIINKGKIVAIDSPENLSRNLSTSSRLLLRAVGEGNKIVDIVKQIPGVLNISIEGCVEEGSNDYSILTNTDYDIRKRLFFDMAKAGYPILEMKKIDMTLEEIFIQLTDEGDEREIKGEAING